MMTMMMMMLAAAAVAAMRQMTVAVRACWATVAVAGSTEVEFGRPAELVVEVPALDLQQCQHHHYHTASTATTITTTTLGQGWKISLYFRKYRIFSIFSIYISSICTYIAKII